MGIFEKLKQFLLGSSRSSKNRKSKARKRTPKKAAHKGRKTARKKTAGSRKLAARKASRQSGPRRRQTTTRKTVRKKAVRSPAGKKKAARKNSKARAVKAAKPPAIRVGEITHFFPKAGAAVLRLEKKLSLSETIVIESDGVKIRQKVKSLQINRIPIDEGKPGEEVGLEVSKPVRPGDKVYRMS